MEKELFFSPMEKSKKWNLRMDNFEGGLVNEIYTIL